MHVGTHHKAWVGREISLLEKTGNVSHFPPTHLHNIGGSCQTLPRDEALLLTLAEALEVTYNVLVDLYGVFVLKMTSFLSKPSSTNTKIPSPRLRGQIVPNVGKI